jgi:CTP synthase
VINFKIDRNIIGDKLIKMRYIIVTGGVISGIGKGITSASIASLFQHIGYTVTMIKIDPYLNIDAGTMSPFEHGECYVLEDGGECDLDLGNYERFLDINLSKYNNITTGKIYNSVIQKERNGEYLGATVQVIPHITDEIIAQIASASLLPISGKLPDICIIEIGGTVGDIEVSPFIEAIQQMKMLEKNDFCHVHVAMAISNPEIKTKPIQHSVSILRSKGIFPNILVVRSNNGINDDIKNKLKRLCQIPSENIINNQDVETIYHVTKLFSDQNICGIISDILKLPPCENEVPPIFSRMISYYNNLNTLPTINLGIVGKYTGSPDTYLSLVRAIEHSSLYLNIKTSINWIDSDNIGDLSLYNCFIIPGGFGSRGIRGKLSVARYARENNIPILGICLGLQIMVVDSLRNLDLDATSKEWDNIHTTDDPLYVIDILEGQTDKKGGTMRLGNYTATLHTEKLRSIYNKDKTKPLIVERHRHRYEVNNTYLQQIVDSGLTISGWSTNNDLVEIVEITNHPFYIGCQFHPEFLSRLTKPHPLFVSLFSSCNAK